MRSCNPCTGNHLTSAPSPIRARACARKRDSCAHRRRWCGSPLQSVNPCGGRAKECPVGIHVLPSVGTEPSTLWHVAIAGKLQQLHLALRLNRIMASEEDARRKEEKRAPGGYLPTYPGSGPTSQPPFPVFISCCIRENAAYSEHALICALCAAHIRSPQPVESWTRRDANAIE